MERFLFNVENNGKDISVSIESIDGRIQILSKIDDGTTVLIPPMTSEQSRIIAMALIEIAVEADNQIAAEVCNL
jgi:hypothetical protein